VLDGGSEVLRDVAMATNFGHNWLCVNDSDGGCLSGRPINADIADTLQLRDVIMATIFWRLYVQEGQHPLAGQRAANFRLLANQ